MNTVSPSQRNREFMNIVNSGKCCITTIVSGDYQWYIPLFLDRIYKEYGEYDVKVFVRGAIDLPKKYCKDVMRFPSALDKCPKNGLFTAAMRFLVCEEELRDYDYVYIADVDAIIMREERMLVDQHMAFLRMNKLWCYNNYLVGATRCPGTHFVTKEWWDVTRESRHTELRKLEKKRKIYKDYDEEMLYRIIKESKLSLPPNAPNLWAHHGIHLGSIRDRVNAKEKHYPQPNAFEQLYMKKLLEDDEFMEIVKECSKHIPMLVDIFDKYRDFVYGERRKDAKSTKQN